jgi:Nif-specific regulatory protein
MEREVSQLELKVLYDICRIVGQILQLDQALNTILEILSRSLAMERATIVLKDLETGLLKIRASHGLRQEERERGIYHPDEGITGLIFRSAQPFVVPDVRQEPLFLNKTKSRAIEKEGLSFIGVPILLHGRPVGVLSVDRLFGTEVSFQEDIRFLTIVAAIIAQFFELNLQVAEREKTLRRENLALRLEVSEKYNHFFMVGKSRPLVELGWLIQKVAPSKASVLLLGESGTGKTLIARIVHELSPRARGPFVKVNCAALPDNLLESELFGHERGAFTGAASTKTGRFEEADGGTIFLDEVGELSLPLQAKLLRFLHEREFERLGSSQTRKVDVRIVAATNKDLASAVEEGLFRGDLFYRLNVFPIHVPPLRERPEDIPLLAEYFLDKACGEYGKNLHFGPRAIVELKSYAWPGNVRELENLIERLVILVDGPLIDADDLPSFLKLHPEVPVRDAGASMSRIEEMERREILGALERNNWIQSRAAKDLGLTLRQVGYRVRKYGLEAFIKNRQRSAGLPDVQEPGSAS